MALVKKDKTSKLDLLALILNTNELLNHCNDYDTLKTIQMSSSALNDLFTCPSQTVWKQLCRKNKYNFLLRKEVRCLWKQSRLIWESIYYQNWKVDLNWSNKKHNIIDLSQLFKDGLIKMINTTLGVSIPTEIDGLVKVWDFKRGIILNSQRVTGLITSICLQGNLLVLGKGCGSMTILRVLCEVNGEVTVKYHSKEIASIIIDVKNNYIYSADIGGQIIRTNFDGNTPIILHQGTSGITGMIMGDDFIMATDLDGSLTKIQLNESLVTKLDFEEFGSINCIGKNDFNMMFLGSDTGILIALLDENQSLEIKLKDSPIVSVVAKAKRVAIGHFDGTVAVYSLKKNDTLTELFTETNLNKGAVWSLAMDEVSLISCSLNGEIFLRQFL